MSVEDNHFLKGLHSIALVLCNELIGDCLKGGFSAAVQRTLCGPWRSLQKVHADSEQKGNKMSRRIDSVRNEFLFLVMPDTGGRRKRGGAWTLSNAHEVGQLVRVQCGLCNVRRWYQPKDLMEIFGDVEAELVGGKMNCERCGKNDCMHVQTQNPSARERQDIRVRRLAEIRVVRRMVWRDEG